MATITPSPFVLKDAIVTLGSNDYQAAVTSATLTPSSSVVTIKGLTPTAVFSSGTNSTWTLDLAFMQSFDTTDLAIYLFNNEGDEVAFVVEPEAGGASFSGTVILTPGAIGGAVDQYGTSTVSLGIKGKPVFTAAV